MDWAVFHELNGLLAGHPTAQDAVRSFNEYAVFVLVGLATLLWLLARPDGSSRLKAAAVGAAASAGLALGANVVLGRIWYQARPFVAHPRLTVLVAPHARDNAFPSDHASVAFAIAVAVLLLVRRIGVPFLVFGLLIAVGRIFEGVHYPSDILASFLVGLGSALVVVFLGRRLLENAVRSISRLTDPVVAPVWRRLA